MRLLPLVGTLLLLSTSVSAQAVGRLQGSVYDSLLTRRALADAEVLIIGLDQTARTDAAGQWTLDSVPAGRWRVTFVHPVLDAARLTAPSRQVDVLAGETSTLALATPSDASLYARLCAEPRTLGTCVLLGDVTIDERPAVGAAARVLWREWTLVPGAEPEETARDATFALDESGRFSICGVPSDRVVTVAVARDGRSHSLEVRLDGRQLGLAHLVLGPAVAGAADVAVAVVPDAQSVVIVEAESSARLTLRGSVRDRDGQPLREARVQLLAAGVQTTTRDDGTFQFANVGREVQTIEVSGLGYIPRRVEIDLRPGRLQRADVALDKVAYVLQPLLVKGKADPRLTALERRLRIGNGQYLTAAQIRQRRALSVSDLVKGMNGVQVRSSGFGTVIVMSRSAGLSGRSLTGLCVPAFFVDGSMVGTETQGDAAADSLLYGAGSVLPRGGEAGAPGAVGSSALVPRDIGPDQFVSVNDIETIEVYNSASQVPPDFATYNGACGVVAIWTRRGLPQVLEESDGL